MKKETTKKVTSKQPILFLRVNATNKAFFQKTARGLSVDKNERVTDSALANLIFSKLRNDKNLLQSILA